MVINEFLPNPVGKDTEGEFIELFNNSQETVSLTGWKLKDVSGKTFTLKNQPIGQAEYLVLDYKTTKISLNNSGETLFLYDQNGNLIDKAEFTGSAPEGESLARQGEKFVFTNQHTPGKANIFKSPSEPKSINSQNNLAANISTNEPIEKSPINNKIFLGVNGFLIGFSLALALAFLSVIILKKINPPE